MTRFTPGLRPITRRLALVAIDSAAVTLAVWAAFAIRLGTWWPYMLERAQLLFVVALVISIPLFVLSGFYRSVLRYAGRDMLYTIVKGATLSLLFIIACWVIIKGPSVPRSAWFIYWFVLVSLTGGTRLMLGDLLRGRLTRVSSGKRVLIYGAGIAGVQLATVLQHDTELVPVAFVDDNEESQGSEILGLKVHAPSRLLKLAQSKKIDTVLLAIPSSSGRRRREILDELAPLSVKVMIMPNLSEIASGKKRIDDLRQVDIEDMLGREPIIPHRELLEACVKDKVVMVTGAGGSIGSELCRQIIRLRPRRLIAYERSEFALYSIERELQALIQQEQNAGLSAGVLVPILGSVGDRPRVQSVLQAFAVNTVYHAAAYKHVPIVEHNPIEGVHNNVVGTLRTAEAAVAAGVETFVLISTDKAVRPTNVMGATKRFAEIVLQGLAAQQKNTRFCMVRFGNVLASSGSVVPLFREQIRKGGPVTVTDPNMVRYFMTLSEAAQLVIQAGSMAEGGDVFLLDMGDPVNITDLARRMIELSGFEVRDENNPDGDTAIQFTGLRPGEKLYEELLIGEDDYPTRHPRIMRAREEMLPWAEVQSHLAGLDRATVGFDYAGIRAVLLEAVNGYRPECGIEDRVWAEYRDTERHESGETLTARSAS